MKYLITQREITIHYILTKNSYIYGEAIIVKLHNTYSI